MARDAAGKALFAAGGAIVGALLVLAVDSATRTPAPSTAPAPRVAPKVISSPTIARTGTDVMLAWSPRSLPAHTEVVLERTPGVLHATTVTTRLDWIERTKGPDGTAIDAPPKGYRIPLETAFIEPAEYALFVPPSERATIRALQPGDALLARTSSELRAGGSGLTLELLDRRVETVGVVSDEAANGYEALMTGEVPQAWPNIEPFVLIQLRDPDQRGRAARTIRRLLPAGHPLRIRSFGETPFLRYGDAVQPQMLIKKAFGEFAARPLASGFLALEPGWRRRNIVTERMPIIGEVTCHRALMAQLRAALVEVRDVGLAHTIDPDQFAGCYAPRFIARNPTNRLSHHSWGIAVDLNLRGNGFGAKPNQDPRLVAVMEAHGFTWGGRWIIPDGMHFEWVRFP